MFWKVCFLIAIGLATSPSGNEKQTTETTNKEVTVGQFFVQLVPQRPDWPNNMTEEEKQIWADHFAFLRDLTEKKICLAAGPVFNNDGTPWFGLIILRASSIEKAREIMSREPGTVNGITTYTIHNMSLALWNKQFTP